MNKTICKRLIRTTYFRLLSKNKEINVKNLEDEMQMVISHYSKEYIAYAKLAVYTMKNSANDKITLDDLFGEIDVLPSIYTKFNAIQEAKKL